MPERSNLAGGMAAAVWGRLVAAAALAAALPVAAASPLALDTHVVASAANSDYAVDAVVADVAGTLTFVNLDLRAHDVVSFADGPATNAWCARFTARACPLFASPLIPLGAQAPVEGIGALVPLQTYAFYCSTHPWMTGTLVAI